jgi:hypothetical protein
MTMPKTDRYPYRPDLHAKIIATAMAGKLLTYSDLGTSRAMVGRYLFRITHEEDAAGRPPITAIVVHKSGGHPGPGFLTAMQEIGFARSEESEPGVWKRAVAAVHGYWRPKLNEDRDTWPRIRG